MKLDPMTLNIILGLLVPFLVAVITKEESSSRVKGVANFVLSAVVGGMATINQLGAEADVSLVIQGIFFTFATSITSYYGLAKPTGATDKVQETTSDFGI